MIVYVLTRIGDGDVIVDGVYSTNKRAELARDQLMENFGVDKEEWKEGRTQEDWEIHREKVNE